MDYGDWDGSDFLFVMWLETNNVIWRYCSVFIWQIGNYCHCMTSHLLVNIADSSYSLFLLNHLEKFIIIATLSAVNFRVVLTDHMEGIVLHLFPGTISHLKIVTMMHIPWRAVLQFMEVKQDTQLLNVMSMSDHYWKNFELLGHSITLRLLFIWTFWVHLGTTNKLLIDLDGYPDISGSMML